MDTSSLLNIEDQLKHAINSNKELEAAINACQEGIYICDAALKCIRVNKAYERITGISSAQLIGKTSDELIKEGLILKAVGPLARKKQKEVSLIQTFPTSRKIVLVTGQPVFDDKGELFCIVVTARDLTELNKLETRLKDLKERSERYFLELSQLKKRQQKEEIIAISTKINDILELVPRISQVDTSVLVQGESGTGKEVFSKLIHDSGPRREHPFIKVNCGAIPGELLESELFGYVKGAFTGADQNGKAGLLEIADKGTLFLDEIGELPLKLQVKLLRVLQDFEITRLGSIHPKKVNVRIICATNRSLKDMVMNGDFREDLFYRINVIPILIPPLRERQPDIQPLIRQTLDKLSKKYSNEKPISIEVLQILELYTWPGNIRELQNLIERLFIMTHNEIIQLNHLPPYIRNSVDETKYTSHLTLKKRLEDIEKKFIQESVKESKNFRQAANQLGLDPSTLTRKCQKYKIRKDN